MADWRESGVWAEEPDEWDQATGAPGIAMFGNALQVWSTLQDKPTSIAAAARAFNVPVSRILEAVNFHAWMFLDPPAGELDHEKVFIDHEGE